MSKLINFFILLLWGGILFAQEVPDTLPDPYLTTNVALLDIDTIIEKMESNTPQLEPIEVSEEPFVNKKDVELNHIRTQAFEYLKNDKPEEAIPLFERIIDEREDRKALFGLGTAYIKIKNYAVADQIFTDYIKTHPDDYIAYNNLAWMYATARNIQFRKGDLAIKYAQKALMIAPSDYHVWSTLSEAYFISGHYERAMKTARQAFNLAQKSKSNEKHQLTYHNQMERAQRALNATTILE